MNTWQFFEQCLRRSAAVLPGELLHKWCWPACDVFTSNLVHSLRLLANGNWLNKILWHSLLLCIPSGKARTLSKPADAWKFRSNNRIFVDTAFYWPAPYISQHRMVSFRDGASDKCGTHVENRSQLKTKERKLYENSEKYIFCYKSQKTYFYDHRPVEKCHRHGDLHYNQAEVRPS